MAKYAIVVMSEHSEGNPGVQARLLHALSAAQDLAGGGKEVGIWFHGVGVTWLHPTARNRKGSLKSDHPQRLGLVSADRARGRR